MKEITTTGCGKQGHPEFHLCFDDDVSAPWIDWLIEHLEKLVRTEKFQDGKTLRIGSMTNLVKADDKGLTICEPDFKSMPAQWTRSVSNTLSHFFLQKSVAGSVALTPCMNFPSYDDTAICCSQFGKDGVGFCALRGQPSPIDPKDSGWVLTCVDPEHDHNIASNMSPVTLYEAATANKLIVPYLALPEQVAIMETGNPSEFHIGLGDRALIVPPGSYLDRWLKDRVVRDVGFNRSIWNSIS
jgi:hypothetical protein